MPLQEELELLRICRAAMPAAAGVVLATAQGRALAHETARVRDPDALAREAAERAHAPPTSALVPRADGLYLVVFVPSPLAEEWASSGTRSLPAA